MESGPSGPPKPIVYETVFTNAKAGMEGVDAEHVKRVVYEASKGSSHFENEQRKDAAAEERIARMRRAAAALSPAQLAGHAASMDARFAELEAGRELGRTWLHVDMDAFFATVEELDQPALRGRPFAVGGIGMISTANYVARQFGVRSAMPGFIAKKLCPQLTFVAPNYENYRRASEATRAVFRDFDPHFQAGSLDEAYLDVTDYCAEHGVTGEQVAATIRGRVQAETRLTCSVGIAPNRTLAKICSDRNKPNGQFCLEPTREAVMAFVRDLPLRKVPGIGKVTFKLLAAFGMHTGGDLLTHRGLLSALFTPSAVDWLSHVALGLAETRHPEGPREGEVGRKGISHERTFSKLSQRADLEAKLRELATALAADMAEEGLKGRTLTLKLKLTNFEVRTRATTLGHHISTADELFTAGQRLLAAELPVELRLMGLRVSNFLEPGRREPGQLSLEQMLARHKGAAGTSGQQQQQQQEGQQQERQQQEQQGAGEGEGGFLPEPAIEAGEHGFAEADLLDDPFEEEEQLARQGREEDEAWEDGGFTAGAEAGVGPSQGLSGGELLELTLRDWQHQERQLSQHQQADSEQGAGPAVSPWPEGGEPSLPPSLAVSPASAARFEREAAAAAAAARGGQPGGYAPLGGRPLHMPPTALDLALQQAADKLAVQAVAAQAGPGPGSSSAAHQAGGGGQQQQGQQQQGSAARPPARQAPQPGWACLTCTFENAKGTFWCEMCGTSRLPPRKQPGTGGKDGSGSSAKPGGSSSRAGLASLFKPGAKPSGGSSSKASGSGGKSGGKRGRNSSGAGAAPTGGSILRFMSRQPSPPAEEQQQQQAQQQEQPADQQEQPADQQVQEQPAGQQEQHPGEEGQQQQQQQQNEAAAGEEEDDEEGVEYGPLPYSPPLLFGEDYFECQFCGEWIRETYLQAHDDEHLARRLQRQEEKMERLLSGAKRPPGSGSSAKQSTLTSFAKRMRQ